MTRVRGRLVQPGGVVPAEVVFDERIREVRVLGEPESGGASPGDGPLIVPGFIDVHVHGGGGGDAMDGADGVRTLATFHARHGTTTIYPTTITNPFDRILDALRGVREVAEETDEATLTVRADVLGAHVEGPFLSPERLGAQPPYAVSASAERTAMILETGAAKLVTLAPEVEDALACAERFAAAGVRVSVGHTRATYEQVADLIVRVHAKGGSVGFTHLYNAMGGIESRNPGVVGAAFAYRDAWGELILDLHHVEAGSALAAWSAKRERLILVTDAIRAAGMPEGDTELGGQHVHVSGGAARLASGTLAGSVLTLDVAIRNAVEIGVPMFDAIWAASAAPAAYLGLEDRGRIEEGLRGDVVLLDDALHLQDVYVGGRRVE